ncbi:MAG: ATP-binding protein, partial [Oscillospiraceae bacterium]|nr:ATP-binding protein [Oscillospiraceae bacterium]
PPHGSGSVYNLLPLLQESSVRPLSDNVNSAEDMLTCESCSVFLRETQDGDQYIVSTPIETGFEEMRLFYFVPVREVNKTTDSFSRYILLLSIVVISAFAVGAVLVFLYLYGLRRRQFNDALVIREHMLDLLVQNSKSAFALLALDQDAPRFRSGNAEKIIGEPFFNLKKTPEGCYQMQGQGERATDALQELNAQLRDWDGKSEFRSAFIRNTASAAPSYFEIQIFPVGENGEERSFVAIAQDVTPLYERQAAAAEALAMAEQANRAKTHFLSRMSHDIRTPMNAIVNMTNFAKESVGEPEKQTEYLDNLSESSAHLLQLINDVLDMSRIESGRVTVACAPFDLSAELERIADIMRPLCAEKKQLLETDFSAARMPAVLGDRVKLSQILMNLLSNANKFTPDAGRIRFTAQALPSLREDVVNLRFTVGDTGIGISKDDLKSIFEPFSRVEDEQVGATEGTGLGLSICRSYVSAMGGTIRCESEPGKGSVFTVELFFQKTSAAVKSPAPQPAEDASFAGRRCLLCEDNPINQAIAVKLLERLGFAVETAANGRDGADKFLAAPAGYYDVIYMDVQMPVMDGYRATAAIRASRRPLAETVPIIAMTANVFAEDVEQARAAGMNGHLGKPILMNDLIETTNKVLKCGGDHDEEGS